jgi:hypothetical protein
MKDVQTLPGAGSEKTNHDGIWRSYMQLQWHYSPISSLSRLYALPPGFSVFGFGFPSSYAK